MLGLDPNSCGYFRCTRLNATLTRDSCGARSTRAQGKLKESERLTMYICIACPVGKEHAAALVPVDSLVRDRVPAQSDAW